MTAKVMTARQLEIMQHALGLDQYGRGAQHRNHYCAGASDEPDCRDLVERGFMVQYPTTGSLPYFNCSVTAWGKEVVREQSPVSPKLSRSQRRVRQQK